ncbi:MAG: NifU family protein [Conexibacteraceae bacterium]|nr:NifU family protein [Conexibacteraceae bacterium]
MSVAQESPAEELVGRVQELQEALDQAPDSPYRELAEELVAAVVQMYGAGIERIVDRLLAAGEAGERAARELAEDELVATLLMIHDLHPVPLRERVQEALDSVRPYMESHGGNVELLGLEHGIARIHLRGSCSDCSASSVTLELAIKQALEAYAPDLEGLEVEGVAPQTAGSGSLPMATGLPQASPPTGLELPVVMSGGSGPPPSPAPPRSTAPAAPAWFSVDSLTELEDASVTPVTVAGTPLIVASVDGSLLAFKDVCAGCGSPLHDGELRAGALLCRHCERSFFLPRAGRALGDEAVQLEPVPLLREHGRVRVALAP